ncbi:hypothetical protein [Nocardia vermiculata]|uniref:hypothetical protein n=1 Tax=Nocardia vermiculata TaxID=257274 RepID=UPI000AA13644|nr:hypothetical protein [Nocardia vermiculata]
MRGGRSIALGFTHPDSDVSEWDLAQLRRLARHLGYTLVWPPQTSRIPLVDQVRATGADVVIVPSTDHLGPVTLQAVMCVADVETVRPRLSFARWASETRP